MPIACTCTWDISQFGIEGIIRLNRTVPEIPLYDAPLRGAHSVPLSLPATLTASVPAED